MAVKNSLQKTGNNAPSQKLTISGYLGQEKIETWINGKKQKISDLAAEGNEIIKKSKNRTNKGFFNRIYGVFNKIIEPRVVIKSLENFNPNGILTRAYNAVTNGETEAGLLYIELTNDIDTYLKKKKGYKKRLASEYITVAGHEMTVGEAINSLSRERHDITARLSVAIVPTKRLFIIT